MVELLLFGEILHVRDLLGAVDEHFEFLNHIGHFLDVAVVLGLLHQVVDAEAAAHDVEQKLVEFRRDLKQSLIVGLPKWLQLLSLRIHDHLALLFVEEQPYAHDAFQVLLAHLLKVRL